MMSKEEKKDLSIEDLELSEEEEIFEETLEELADGNGGEENE